VLHVVVAAAEGGGGSSAETNLHFRALSHAFAGTHTRAGREATSLSRSHPLPGPRKKSTVNCNNTSQPAYVCVSNNVRARSFLLCAVSVFVAGSVPTSPSPSTQIVAQLRLNKNVINVK